MGVYKLRPKPVFGEASIQKRQVPPFQTLEMFLGQLPFPGRPGLKEGLNGNAIEHVGYVSL